MTEQPDVPTVITSVVCSSSTYYTTKVESGYKYHLACKPCDVKWRSPLPKDNCWSCGKETVQWK